MFVFSLFIMVLGMCCCTGSKAPEPSSAMPSIIQKQYFDGVKDIGEVVILGSGPAGSAAALYAARSGRKPIVLAGDVPGGLLTKTRWVENWPGADRILGPDLVAQLQKQAEQFGAVYINDTATSVDFSQWPYVIHTEEGRTLRPLTIIIATGAAPRKLGVKGEEDYFGNGVTTCAICDAPFYKNKNVVVVGGGDSAAEEAMQLAPFAKKVTILVRKEKMRASAHMQKLLSDFPHISVEYNKEIREIIGNGSHVTDIILFDSATDMTEKRPIDGVFLAIGHEPNTQLFKDYIEIDGLGYIVVKGRSQATNIPGIFAAGDVEDHTYRQAGVAAGSGIKAALDADSELNRRGYTAEIAQTLEGQNQLFDPRTIRSKTDFFTVREIKDLDRLQINDKPIILDFYTEQCPACIKMMPVFESVAQEYAGKALFSKIDANEASDLAEEYNITTVPTILVFKGKSLVGRYNVMSRAQLAAAIDQVVE